MRMDPFHIHLFFNPYHSSRYYHENMFSDPIPHFNYSFLHPIHPGALNYIQPDPVKIPLSNGMRYYVKCREPGCTLCVIICTRVHVLIYNYSSTWTSERQSYYERCGLETFLLEQVYSILNHGVETLYEDKRDYCTVVYSSYILKKTVMCVFANRLLSSPNI